MSSWTTPAVSCRICKTSEFEDLSDALETTIDNSFNRVLLADIVYNTLGIQVNFLFRFINVFLLITFILDQER